MTRREFTRARPRRNSFRATESERPTRIAADGPAGTAGGSSRLWVLALAKGGATGPPEHDPGQQGQQVSNYKNSSSGVDLWDNLVGIQNHAGQQSHQRDNQQNHLDLLADQIGHANRVPQ